MNKTQGKECSRCKEVKDLSGFYKNPNTRDARHSWCKACMTGWAKERYQSLPPDERWAVKLWASFKITPAEYIEMLQSQGGGCAICGRAATPEDARRLAVDHDHSCCPGRRTCGKCIRGLLCFPCNSGLGKFGDDPNLLRRAISYIGGNS